jgi:hypothetical protein
MIVEHSIARHQAQRRLCLSAARSVQALLGERDELLAEVNRWRAASAVPVPAREPGPVQQQLQELSAVDNETCGSFPNGFGDNSPEEGSGDDQYHDETLRNINHVPASDRPPTDVGVFDFALPPGCFIDANQPLDAYSADFDDLLHHNPTMHEHEVGHGFFREPSILQDYQCSTTTSSAPPQSWYDSHQYLLGTVSTHPGV